MLLVVFFSFTARCNAATRLTTCQKAYYMLRQCGSELFDSQNAGPQCCELLSAFNIRKCIESDNRLQGFVNKSTKAMQPLRSVCAKEAPIIPAASASASTEKKEKALEEATRGVSKARGEDSSMFNDFMAIADAVISSGTETPRTVTVNFEVEGNAGNIETTIAAVASVAKRAAQTSNMLLQEISVELEADRSSGMCSCNNSEMPEDIGDAYTNWRGYLRLTYLSTRLQLCKLICAHRTLVLGALFVQLVALASGLLYLAFCPRKGSTGEITLPRHGCFEKSPSCNFIPAQFISKTVEVPEIEQPLLGDEEKGMLR